MFTHVLYTSIRMFVIPAGAIYFLSNSFVGYQGAFLGVSTVLTVITIPVVMWQMIKILPNIALIKTKKVLKLAIDIAIEITAVVIFWVIYIGIFG